MSTQQKTNQLLFKNLLQHFNAIQSDNILPVLLGKDIAGNFLFYDLNKLSRILIAGKTKTGKTNLIHSIIYSLIECRANNPCKFLIISSNEFDYENFKNMPNLLSPIKKYEYKEILNDMTLVLKELNDRHVKFEQAKVKNILQYNERNPDSMYSLVIIIDDFADLYIKHPQDIEDFIQKVSTFGESAGIHIIISTKHIDKTIINNFISANLTTHIAFKTDSAQESDILIASSAATKLQGQDDMLLRKAAEPVVHILSAYSASIL